MAQQYAISGAIQQCDLFLERFDQRRSGVGNYRQ